MTQQPRTWWSQHYIEMLSSVIDAARLTRGKSYASPHRILQFDHNLNKITARVRGNKNLYFGITKEPTYHVAITFPIINEVLWPDIITIIGNNPAWLSQLLMKTVPLDIEQAFLPLKKSLTPQSKKDFDCSCDCPDYEHFCKHIAGVFYYLANLLDSNPLLLFELRGLDQNQFIKLLSNTELGSALCEQLTISHDLTMEFPKSLYGTTTEKEHLPKNFWHLPTPDALLQLDSMLSTQNSPENNDTVFAATIKTQGDYPPFWPKQQSFIAAMEHLYQVVLLKNKKRLL